MNHDPGPEAGCPVCHPLSCLSWAPTAPSAASPTWCARPAITAILFGTEAIDRDLDLSGHPDVIAAWRRHRNLIARHGRAAVHDVYETSARIVGDWDWHLQIRPLPAVTARLDRLCAGGSCTYLDPVVHAARYPATVALTSLLTSPHWRPLAFNANDACVRRFLQRVADTVTDGYHPTGGQDPLRHHLSTGVPALRVLPSPPLPINESLAQQ